MLNLYLVRHAKQKRGKEGLDSKGKRQAKALSKRLKKIKWNKFYSSDLPRCRETAEIISKIIKIKPQFSKELREVSLEVKNNPEKHKKKINTILKICKKLSNEKGNILVVSSGVVNRILIGLSLGIPLPSCNFIQDNTGVTRIYFTKGKVLALYVNDVSHLAKKLQSRIRD